MAELTLTIEGMSCQHCVASVKKALDAVKGVKETDVAVGSATIIFDDSKTDRDVLIRAVQDAGYTITA